MTPDDREAVERPLERLGLAVRHWPSVRTCQAATDGGDSGCLIVDPFHSGSDNRENLAQLSEQIALTPVVILSRHIDVAGAVSAMKAGAIDVLTYPIDEIALADAVERGLRAQYCRRARAAAISAAQAAIDLLSPRERDVLDALIGGASNKAIAQRLAISSRTVEIHRARVMAKLGATSLAQVIRIAFAADIY